MYEESKKRYRYLLKSKTKKEAYLTYYEQGLCQ